MRISRMHTEGKQQASKSANCKNKLRKRDSKQTNCMNAWSQKAIKSASKLQKFWQTTEVEYKETNCSNASNKTIKKDTKQLVCKQTGIKG